MILCLTPGNSSQLSGRRPRRIHLDAQNFEPIYLLDFETLTLPLDLEGPDSEMDILKKAVTFF